MRLAPSPPEFKVGAPRPAAPPPAPRPLPPPAHRAQEETGFLFEAGDTAQLAGYVERLITDRPLAERMAAAARAEAER